MTNAAKIANARRQIRKLTAAAAGAYQEFQELRGLALDGECDRWSLESLARSITLQEKALSIAEAFDFVEHARRIRLALDEDRTTFLRVGTCTN